MSSGVAWTTVRRPSDTGVGAVNGESAPNGSDGVEAGEGVEAREGEGVEERERGRATVLVKGDTKMIGQQPEGGDAEIGVGDADSEFVRR